MTSPLVPATPAFDATGTPYSPEYGDVYHSADSGPGQARHVFLGGNNLPARWGVACKPRLRHNTTAWNFDHDPPALR